MKVRIFKQSGNINKYPYYSPDKVTLCIENDIYNGLKTVTQNEILTLDDGSIEFQKFLQDMEYLHNEIINGDTSMQYPAELINLDRYLGSLGIDEFYPIKSDVPKITKTVNADLVLEN